MLSARSPLVIICLGLLLLTVTYGQEVNRDTVEELFGEDFRGHVTRIGNCVVLVTDALITYMPIETLGEAGISSEPYMAIQVAIVNTSETAKVNYLGWAPDLLGVRTHMASARDEHGNSYKRIRGGATKIIDQLQDGESIHPGQKIIDYLVFEMPINDAKRITLTLPAEGLDESGSPIKLELTIAEGHFDNSRIEYKPAPVPWLTVKSKSGNHTCQAQLVWLSDLKAKLKLKDGKKIEVELAAIDENSRNRLEEEKNRQMKERRRAAIARRRSR